MLWYLLLTQRDHFAFPASCATDTENPFQLCERAWLAHVINSAGCAIVHDRKCDRSGYVLNISSRPMPTRVILSEDNGFSSVDHPFEIINRPVISWAVHSGQAQHGSWYFRSAHYNLLNGNLVVVERH